MAIDWQATSVAYFNPANPKKPMAVFLNTYTGAGFDMLGRWATIDLKPFGVDPAAKWALLSGILIITGAGDLTVALRAPGDTLTLDNYVGQALQADPSGGARSTMASIMPLVNGCFEIGICATRYPNTAPVALGSIPSFGVNLSLQQWGM